MTTNDGTVGRYLGWFLVALSLGSGVIHFAVAGGHFDLSWSHGAFFAAVAWLQLVWAAAFIIRPTRRLLALAAVGNALISATWIMSRVWGVPVGPNAWEPEPVSLADALATGFEAGIVVLALAVLFRPAVAERSIRPRLGLAGVSTTGVAIAIVSTFALSPSMASDHHGGQGGSLQEEATGHSHGEDGSEADLAGLTEGEGHDDEHGEGYMIMADGTSPCEQSGFANDGNSGHGHRGPTPYVPLEQAEHDLFVEQVRQANEVIATHPTVADAEADGYTLILDYVPCIAAHYVKSSAFGNGFDPIEPEVILYTGTSPDSEVAGLSYLEFGDPDEPPEGFAGDNDLWHVHESLCIGEAGVVGDESTTDDECASRGGSNRDLADLWMMHMWNAPGWASDWGLFSGENPNLGGTYGDIIAEPRRQSDDDEDDD